MSEDATTSPPRFGQTLPLNLAPALPHNAIPLLDCLFLPGPVSRYV